MRHLYVIPLVLLALVGGCVWNSHGEPAKVSQKESKANSFQEWQIIHMESGKSPAFESWMNELAAQDVIYVGEEHYNRYHVEGATRVLHALLTRGRRPVLAVEMFGWDGQKGLDRYLSDPLMDRKQFLDEARWKQNWPGGDFKDYQPLVQFAREHHLSMLAMNPPLSLVRKVSKQGLTQARNDAEMEQWAMSGESIVDEPAYRGLIMDQLRQCHGGMSDEVYERIYEASMFRDEGMAKTIAAILENAGDGEGPIVSYTGGGHIQNRLPVPNRVVRRRGDSVRQATVYMVALEPDHPEYIRELLKENIADYLWLTPLSEHGPPRRCG